MFDDIARNLVPARALGMTTVWLQDRRALAASTDSDGRRPWRYRS